MNAVVTSLQLLEALTGRWITSVERMFYVVDDEVDTADGPLELVLDDGVVHVAGGPDGQTLVVTDTAWDDPFVGPLSAENAEYVRTHGCWRRFDVSAEPGWVGLLGRPIDRVQPDRSAGFLNGVRLFVGRSVVDVEVVADELHVVVVGRDPATLADFTPVRIVSDRFAGEGVQRGTVGYVVETHADGAFEVEVSSPDTGETLALLTATHLDLEPVAAG